MVTVPAKRKTIKIMKLHTEGLYSTQHGPWRRKPKKRLIDVLSPAAESPAQQDAFGVKELLRLDLNGTVPTGLQSSNAAITEAQTETGTTTKRIQRNLAVMSVGLASAVVGGIMAAPALLLFSAGCQIYYLTSYYQKAYKSLAQEKRLTVNVLDSFLLTGALLGGFVVTAAIANWFVVVIRLMIANTEDHSMQRLVTLFGEQPSHVWVFLDGLEIEIPFELVKPDDIVVVNAGQMVPIDGTIVSSIGLVDQKRLTGESQPVEKSAGDPVFAATVVLSGKVFIRVGTAGTETLAAKIGESLNQTTDYRMNIESDAIAFVDKMTVPTMILSAMALPVAGLSGATGRLVECAGL